MQRTLLVTEEIKRAGFIAKTDVNTKSILVSLKNRKPSQMEVKTALEQIFDELVSGFTVKSLTNSVLVVVE